MTPEGKVKKQIKKVLDKYRNNRLWSFMPVPYGYGARTVDYIGCCNSLFFSIEAKAPGKKPTALQEQTLTAHKKARGKTFVIDGTENTDTVEDLDRWIEDTLMTVSEIVPCVPETCRDALP